MSAQDRDITQAVEPHSGLEEHFIKATVRVLHGVGIAARYDFPGCLFFDALGREWATAYTGLHVNDNEGHGEEFLGDERLVALESKGTLIVQGHAQCRRVRRHAARRDRGRPRGGAAMKCCYCGGDLGGGYIEGIPAWDHQILWREDAEARYCSAGCLIKRVGELFIRTELPDERWPRFSVEVPPELAVLLDILQERALGANRSAASRRALASCAPA